MIGNCDNCGREVKLVPCNPAPKVWHPDNYPGTEYLCVECAEARYPLPRDPNDYNEEDYDGSSL